MLQAQVAKLLCVSDTCRKGRRRTLFGASPLRRSEYSRARALGAEAAEHQFCQVQGIPIALQRAVQRARRPCRARDRPRWSFRRPCRARDRSCRAFRRPCRARGRSCRALRPSWPDPCAQGPAVQQRRCAARRAPNASVASSVCCETRCSRRGTAEERPAKRRDGYWV